MANEKGLRPGTILHSHKRDYKVLKVLGSGGFGITYLVEANIHVENISIRAEFALKEHFISSLCDRDSNTLQVSFSDPVRDIVISNRRAFLREANRLQSLGIRHHNIVKINEVFEANNTAYYVMEYLEGETLQHYIERRGTLSATETLQLLRPIIHAVATLHSNNITHYDIKPANIILVADSPGAMHPVLIDFGLSKHYDDSGAGTSSLLSQGYTPGYAPVEQYTGLTTYTPQADVYALAATIYCCLMGHKPAVATEFDVDALPQELAGKAPQSLISILQRAMAMARQKRTPDAETFFRILYNDVELDSEKTLIDIDSSQEDKTIELSKEETSEIPPLLPSEEQVIATARKVYDVVGTFEDGMALVGQYGKFGFINRSGVLIVMPQYNYDDLKSFSEGRAAIKKYGKWGFIDKNGDEVIEPLHDDAWTFSDGLARVMKDDKYGFIDKNGNEVIKPQYDDAWYFSEGLAIVKKDDKYGFIDKNGNEVIKPQYDDAWYFSEGLARVMKDDKYGFIDKNGNEVIKPQYEYASDFSDGLAPVMKDGNYGFIDKNGNEVIKPQYDNTGDFSDGLAPVKKKEDKYGFIDKNGNEVIKPQYEYASDFSDGLAPVMKDGNYGFIDKNGNEVIKPQYDDAWGFSEGWAPIKKGGKWGFIDKNGRLVIKPEYDFVEEHVVEDFIDGLAKVKKDGIKGYIDKAGNFMPAKD